MPVDSKVIDLESQTCESLDESSSSASVSPTTAESEKMTFDMEDESTVQYMLVIMGAIALAFNAGFVNGCTLQYKDIPVSHITGTVSHAALGLAKGDYNNLDINLAVVVSFITGSAITGSMVPSDHFEAGLEYANLFFIAAFLFLLACFVSITLPESDWYFYLAAIASGLQNGISLRYSGAIIRTSHVTGAGTDIGLTIGRVLMGEGKEFWKLQVLCPIILSFFAGGVVSVRAYEALGKLALLVNVLVFFIVGVVYSIVISRKWHGRIRGVFTGWVSSRKPRRPTLSVTSEEGDRLLPLSYQSQV